MYLFTFNVNNAVCYNLALMNGIYADCNATTPVSEAVLKAMAPWWTHQFGNPASAYHQWGWEAEAGIEMAVDTLSACFDPKPETFLFTSGSTEALNTAIKGWALQPIHQNKTILALATEHPAVLQPLMWLKSIGHNVIIAPVNQNGWINDNELTALLAQHNPGLWIVQYANNETGLVYPIEKWYQMATEWGWLMGCDATQAPGKIPIDTLLQHCDWAALSAHKCYGPKGVGLLLAKKPLRLIPLLHGGSQQGELRGGTVAVPLAIGMAEALHLAHSNTQQAAKHLTALQTKFEKAAIDHQWGQIVLQQQPRLPNTTLLLFHAISLRHLLQHFPLLGVSSGSACGSGSAKPSNVLTALGYSNAEINNAVRFSFGTQNTLDEVELIINKINTILK